MRFAEIKQVIEAHAGTIEGGINWTWAKFPDDAKGKAAFAIVEPHVDHRGYYDGAPNSSNPNLRQGGFRFR